MEGGEGGRRGTGSEGEVSVHPFIFSGAGEDAMGKMNAHLHFDALRSTKVIKGMGWCIHSHVFIKKGVAGNCYLPFPFIFIQRVNVNGGSNMEFTPDCPFN